MQAVEVCWTLCRRPSCDQGNCRCRFGGGPAGNAASAQWQRLRGSQHREGEAGVSRQSACSAPRLARLSWLAACISKPHDRNTRQLPLQAALAAAQTAAQAVLSGSQAAALASAKTARDLAQAAADAVLNGAQVGVEATANASVHRPASASRQLPKCVAGQAAATLHSV